VTAVVHVLPGHPVVPAILEFMEGLLEPAADGVDLGIGVCGALRHGGEVREALDGSLHVAGIRLGDGRLEDRRCTEDEEFAEEQLAGGSGQLAASRERSAKRSGQSVNATAAVSNQPSAIGNQQSAIGNRQSSQGTRRGCHTGVACGVTRGIADCRLRNAPACRIRRAGIAESLQAQAMD